MIKGYITDRGRLQGAEEVLAGLAEVVWIDLLSPTEDEETMIERALAVDIPSREEMEEIETSSRLYYHEGAAFMTATLPAQADRDDPQMAPVTFVLVGERLITVRYHDPRSFRTFEQRVLTDGLGGSSAQAVLMALLEAVIERLADILERAARDIDGVSHDIFRHTAATPVRTRNFQGVLEEIGRKGDLLSDIRESLLTFGRLFGFLGQVVPPLDGDTAVRGRLKSLVRDGRSLTDHAAFLSQKITFLLDATLGMINIEQNAIIKIFSVAAVVFLPPTLIASIYGMNFEHMPELNWTFGYLLALGVMVVSAILPYWLFKRRGWL